MNCMEKYFNLKQAFAKNYIGFVSLHAKEDVIPYLREQMPEGSTVGTGGSVTLDECGVREWLRSGAYTYYDRDRPGADVREEYLNSFRADFYLCSAQAITEHGEAYLVDGRGNRVAAVTYGPEKVFLICGKNKLVKNLREAVIRTETIAAPMNVNRLHMKTYCSEKGTCAKTDVSDDDLMCGFRCGNSICSYNMAVTRQRQEWRITVVLVDEELGY